MILQNCLLCFTIHFFSACYFSLLDWLQLSNFFFSFITLVSLSILLLRAFQDNLQKNSTFSVCNSTFYLRVQIIKILQILFPTVKQRSKNEFHLLLYISSRHMRASQLWQFYTLSHIKKQTSAMTRERVFMRKLFPGKAWAAEKIQFNFSWKMFQ